MGYFWKTLERDACQYVKICKKCQYHGNLIHAPAQELHPFVTPWPFYQWGFDLIGMIYPPSSNGHKYIITATEYFTKWVEAVPLSTATGKQISMFILNHIICRYGIPHAIITDNGKQFKNKDIDELCDTFHITHHSSSIYYPQGNGQAEATNKNILKILRRSVGKSGKDWHLQINPALWAYRTSIRTPTGATPFSLVYGAEAVLPLEVEIPSLRVSLHGLITDEDYRVARLHQLDLLEEHQTQAYDHLKVYQNRLSRNYNKHIKPRNFQIGDLVLRENPKNQADREKKGKWEANWLGPFVITSSFGTGAYKLADCNGDELLEPINSIHLKRFHT